MNDLVSLLGSYGQTNLAAFFLVFLRVGAVLALVPAFSEQSIPQRVRLGIAVAFTAVVYPAVATEMTEITSRGMNGVYAIGTEVLAGLTLGVGMRLFIFALQMAGSIAAQSTSLSQILGSAQAEPTAAIGQLLLVAALALSVMNGLHVKVAEALIMSYETFEPGKAPIAGDIAEWGIDRISRAFALAFTLSAPFIIASLVYNVALGVINRAMPQLMVAMVGAPAITLGGLALLFIVTPIMLSVWWTEFSVFLFDPFGAPK
jgi:flagellar biosynthetic protein FliR